ncbi:MAG: glycosyltransferase family 39 protein [Ignavibacteria bacterium]|nr:glycosyltransferase family 39 protein [Ignavibacteria bacterium]
MAKRISGQPSGFFSSRTNLILTILVSAAAARIAVLVMAADTFLWDGIWSDAETYHEWARRIVASNNWWGDELFFMSPLYAYFLAATYSLFGESLLAVRLLQAAAGAGTAILIFLIGEKLFTRKAAFVAGLLAALYGPFLLSSVLLLVETLKVLFLVLTFWFLVVAVKKEQTRWWFGAGASLGLAVLCRPTDLLVIPVIAAWVWFMGSGTTRGRGMKIAAVLGGVLLIVGPVAIRNYAVSGEFVPVTSNGGLNFYLGNNPHAVGVYYNVARLDLQNDPDGRVYLETETGRALSHSEVSSLWMSKAVDFIADDPVGFLTLFGRKFLLFFHQKEISQVGYNYLFVGQHAVPLLRIAPAFLVAGSLGCIGFILAMGRWRKLFLLYGFLLVEILAVVLFFMTDRFRLSAVPFFLIFAGFAVTEMYDIVQGRDFRKIGIVLLILSVAVSCMTVLNVTVADDFSLEWEYVGLRHLDRKQHREALQAFQEAGRYKDSFHLRNNIGNVYVALGQTDAAIRQFQEAHRMNPDQPISSFSIGTAHASRQEWAPALAAFDRAIAINARFAPAHLNRGLVLYYLQRFSEALAALRSYVVLEKDQSKLATVYGDIRNLEQIVRQQQQGASAP